MFSVTYHFDKRSPRCIINGIVEATLFPNSNGWRHVFWFVYDERKYVIKIDSVQVDTSSSWKNEQTKIEALFYQRIDAEDRKHFAEIVESGITDSGLCYVIQKFVEGKIFQDYTDNCYDFSERTKLVSVMCQALSPIIEKYRLDDIYYNYGNIMVTQDNNFVIVDYGGAGLYVGVA